MRNETVIKIAKQISIKQRYLRVIFFFLNLIFLATENKTIKMIQSKYYGKNRINPCLNRRHYSISDIIYFLIIIKISKLGIYIYINR